MERIYGKNYTFSAWWCDERQLWMHELKLYAHILILKDVRNGTNSEIKVDPRMRVSFLTSILQDLAIVNF